MSSTRSPSPVAPVTRAEAPEILIVSHGSPSEPDPQELFVQGLAKTVAKLTGQHVVGATLAKDGALDAAVEGLTRPLVFPHFMADGWFVSTNLPNRLLASGLNAWDVAVPLGMLDALPQLALDRLRSAVSDNGLTAQETTLVVAAHGSPSDTRPARATEAFAAALRRTGRFQAVRVGYVDEAPSLEDAADVTGPAIVLPFFAARAGHVLIDVPEALDAVQSKGTILPPIGTWQEVPTLIAGASFAHFKACVA